RAAGPFRAGGRGAALETLLHGQPEFASLVGAGDRAKAPACPASEDPTEEVLDIDAAQVAAKACADPATAGAPRGSRAGPAAPERLGIHVLGHLPEIRAEGI